MISGNWIARIVSYNNDSETFEINWIDLQMSYKDDFQTHKNLLQEKCLTKKDLSVWYICANLSWVFYENPNYSDIV